MALTHRSYSYENGGLPTNERLEFLGDAVLGLTITEELYHRHPDRSEGDLAKLRASIVNTQALADVGRGAVRRRSRRLPAAGQGRGELRRRRQVEHSGRRRRILARRNLSRARHLGRARGDPAVVPHAARDRADAGRGAGLEEQPAGADRRARYGRAVLRGDGDRTRSRQGVHRDGRRDRHRVRQGRRPDQEGSRAQGRRGGVDGARPPPTSMPELPEVEVVRRGLEAHVAGKTITAVRVHHPRAVRRHEAGPRRPDRAAARTRASPAPAAAASTCG